MEITNRFAQLWQDWDDTVHARADIPRFLEHARDEDLVELLAAESKRDRKYERDVIATEVLNRLRRRHTDLPRAAEEVLRSAEAAYEAAATGQKAIHTAESILKAEGDEALGSAVSASAYASLDTTRLAFEAAQRNSADVQATLSQSRVADQLAKDAHDTARKGVEATRDAADTLQETGHRAEAEAAHEAASRIEEAAEATRAAVNEERDVEGIR